ncbi:hypothetical protein EON82_05865 [bacterium]|nr:MAG: hypothetical protein EON82_05865 [bacterium]
MHVAQSMGRLTEASAAQRVTDPKVVLTQQQEPARGRSYASCDAKKHPRLVNWVRLKDLDARGLGANVEFA